MQRDSEGKRFWVVQYGRDEVRLHLDYPWYDDEAGGGDGSDGTKPNSQMVSSSGTNSSGRYVDVWIDWPHHVMPQPPNQSTPTPSLQSATCKLRIDLYGDFKSQIPLQRDAEITVYDWLDPAPRSVRSQNFD